MLKGIGVSPGIVIGKAFLLDSQDIAISKERISEAKISEEIARFEEAMTQARCEVLDIQKKINQEIGIEHSDIFNAHLLILEDRTLIEEVIGKLKKEKVNIEYAFSKVLKKYIQIFSKIDDEYLKERVSDVKDVGKRVMRKLLDKKAQTLVDWKEEVIVVDHDISPSDTALMRKERVIGFVTDIGGRTSHTAIMARALEIPAVVGLGTVSRQVKSGDILIVNGSQGIVVINPDKATIKKYQEERKKFEKFLKELNKLKKLPAETLDGHKVELSANIELPSEVHSVIAHGAKGIGLYRTEFFYMNRQDLPTEEEHFQAYRQVAQAVVPYSVIIRTLDLGGDKFLSHFEIPREINPFLGWRAIRFCLARPDIFKTQLRAILRASAYGNLKIMYPMISGLEELRSANDILKLVKKDLRETNTPFDESIEVGVMIETPSAALICDILAKETNFFSIGTNDLIQYSLAVDRSNEKIAYLYEPAHPAILRLIKHIIDTGHKAGIWVGLCGEMGSDPLLVILLLGLGLDEFSASSIALPQIKRAIRSVSLKEAKEITSRALRLSSAEEIKEFVAQRLKKLIRI
ncbi:MAG: phosphoenolpyruvate--protein phosphotransferase [Candidatus Omnitrophota bacterium]|nr:phosphoenolpyruvate--protein phosphotransferase [Candidatus Omnitrophota bacterium]